MASCSSSLLLMTDDFVKILQDMVFTFGKYHEAQADLKQAVRALDAPDPQALAMNYSSLSELLASVWSCESKYIAAFGPTGCGKSTLLNMLLWLTCLAGEEYGKGIKRDPSVLRDIAKSYGKEQEGGSRVSEGVVELSQSSADHGQGDDPSRSVVSAPDIKKERLAMASVLGVCCAGSRESYLSTHLTELDNRPFLLPSGRMGDAGTTKVTAIEWGSKFVGRIRWVSSSKLRKQFKELRQLVGPNKEGEEVCKEDEVKKSELKELWKSLWKLIGMPDPGPEKESEVDTLIKSLGKIVKLGKEEVVGCSPTKGFMWDRIAVRDGMHRRLCEERLGILVEDIRIQAPIPSLEGGVVLLDVPGSNDPRSLHQKETRDAIGRVSLILLILDKAVIDKDTEKMLEENPVLDRMLVDKDDASCNLVVVGIAEKGHSRTGSYQDLITNFDVGNRLSSVMRSILFKKASKLVQRKEMTKEVAKQVVNSIINSNRFTVLPVLPLLAASVHLSPANHDLHKIFCLSPEEETCIMKMDPGDVRRKVLMTNIPQLLERIHSVRRPPNEAQLLESIETALSFITNLENNAQIDETVRDFLVEELKFIMRKSAEEIKLPQPPPLELDWVTAKFAACQSGSQMSLDDQSSLRQELADKAKISALQASKHLLPLENICLRGFHPGNVGLLASKLLEPARKLSEDYVGQLHKGLCKKVRGPDFRFEGSFASLSEGGGLFYLSLKNQVEQTWELILKQIRARCLDEGLRQLRLAIVKACDKGVLHTLKELKALRSVSGFRIRLDEVLLKNSMADKAAEFADPSVKAIMNEFWTNFTKAVTLKVRDLWTQWQTESEKLSKSVSERLTFSGQKRGREDNQQASDDCLAEFEASLEEQKRKLQELKNRLKMRMATGTASSLDDEEDGGYGYTLLQKDQKFSFEPGPEASNPPSQTPQQSCRDTLMRPGTQLIGRAASAPTGVGKAPTVRITVPTSPRPVQTPRRPAGSPHSKVITISPDEVRQLSPHPSPSRGRGNKRR